MLNASHSNNQLCKNCRFKFLHKKINNGIVNNAGMYTHVYNVYQTYLQNICTTSIFTTSTNPQLLYLLLNHRSFFYYYTLTSPPPPSPIFLQKVMATMLSRVSFCVFLLIRKQKDDTQHTRHSFYLLLPSFLKRSLLFFSLSFFATGISFWKKYTEHLQKKQDSFFLWKYAAVLLHVTTHQLSSQTI